MAEAVEWTRTRASLSAQGREYNFAIIGSDARFLGGCGLNQINRTHRFVAFQNTDLLRLEIVCAVGNQRSQRVAERAGRCERES